MQLIKDVTAEHACNEVELYMGMVMEEQQTFESLVHHLKNVFFLAKPSASGLVISAVGPRRKVSLKMHLQMIYRC